MEEKSLYAKLFEGFTGERPKYDMDFGEDVGRERIWSMSDEELVKSDWEAIGGDMKNVMGLDKD